MSTYKYLRNALLAISALSAIGISSVSAEVPASLCPENRIVYKVKDFIGQYPDEEERAKGHWNCFDGNAGSPTSIACTYVDDDDITKYSDVYRCKAGWEAFSDILRENRPMQLYGR